MLLQESPGVPKENEEVEREAAAARLGAERRRLFLAGALLSPLAALLPYLTGALPLDRSTARKAMLPPMAHSARVRRRSSAGPPVSG